MKNDASSSRPTRSENLHLVGDGALKSRTGLTNHARLDPRVPGLGQSVTLQDPGACDGGRWLDVTAK